MSQISILLPTYNRPELLPHALHCLQQQTFKEWKAYIINDGGEDVSSIVASFQDTRFEYYNREHKGKSAALNFGLSKVNTKYISYMDDDDELFPYHLKVLYKAAEEHNKEFVFSDTQLTRLDTTGKIISQTIENTEDVTYSSIRCYNKINHKQILHTKTLQERVGLYDERMSILIDYDFIRRLAYLEEPFHVKKVTGNHFLRETQTNTGMSNSISELWTKDPIKCGKSLLALFEKTPEDLVYLYQEREQDISPVEFIKKMNHANKLLKKALDIEANLRKVIEEKDIRIQALENLLAEKI